MSRSPSRVLRHRGCGTVATASSSFRIFARAVRTGHQPDRLCPGAGNRSSQCRRARDRVADALRPSHRTDRRDRREDWRVATFRRPRWRSACCRDGPSTGGTHTMARIAGSVPSVTFSQNSDFAQLTIRGIGTNVVFAGSDPSSAVYVDGVYLARPAMVLARLPGSRARRDTARPAGDSLWPQRRRRSRQPGHASRPPTPWRRRRDLVAGTLGTFRTEARLSGPIVRDRILGSAAFLRGVRDGFVRDVDHPDHPLGGEDVTAARAQLHFVFNRHSDLLLSGRLQPSGIRSR